MYPSRYIFKNAAFTPVTAFAPDIVIVSYLLRLYYGAAKDDDAMTKIRMFPASVA